jgi:hypothetical protein
MEKGDLAWITLTSQRIYIGMIHTATFDSADANNIVLIPMLSGYRDRETWICMWSTTTAHGTPTMTLTCARR